jgi:asparagine synthase (glutamine-hydrolysing)
MCGIAGIFSADPASREKIQAMVESQKHRGPDASGFYNDDHIALGHNRLSIIDLDPRSDQPMISACGNYVIVFNGEIYNYKELKQLLKEYPFHTTSDTEVLLAAYIMWGKEMLDRLNGMFAFAIWNKKEQALFAARDRFGVKPFYFAVQENNFYFSSEIKALWAAGINKQPELSVWAGYLMEGSYGMPHQSFWKGIEQLPGGHLLEFKNGQIDIKPWYDFVDRVRALDENKNEEEYLALLEDTIQLRFRSDVPVGISLSGGLDSSLLLSLVKKIHPYSEDVTAFSFYTGHLDYDELPWVEKMTRQTKTKLEACLLQAGEVPSLFEKISAYQDEPFGGLPTIAYSQVFKKAREKGYKVILDGQGMDEAWAGYDYYRNDSGFTTQGLKASPYRPEVLEEELKTHFIKTSYPAPFGERLKDLQYRDLFFTKLPRALRFNDRISMMHSVELREPFLDHRLVEWAVSQADELKIYEAKGKYQLRKIVSSFTGDCIALAPKRAMQTPQREWFRKELAGFVETKILGSQDFILNKAEVKKSLEQYITSEKPDAAIHLGQWLNISYFI